MSLYKTYLMRSVAVGAMALLLTACTVGPDFLKPDSKLPPVWVSGAMSTDNAALQQDWWRNFHDPVLDQLIAKATSENIDLKIAETRIAQARASRSVARADFLPTGNAVADSERQGNRLAFPGGGPFDLTKPFNSFEAGFDATWELDLFGGKRRALEQANDQLQSAEATRDDARISLLAEVAQTYAEIRGNQQQLAIVNDTIASDQTTLRIANERFNAGFDAHIDVTRAQAELDQTQSQLPYFQNLLAQAEFRLDVLLGAQPGSAHALTANNGVIPTTSETLVIAAPSAVIAHRPDIRMAERTLAAATAQKGVAIAKLFPDLSISGFLGVLNTDSGHLLDAASKSWSIGGNVLWPILNYGKLSAGIDTADALQKEALLQYQKAVLTALSDVERSYTAYIREREHSAALEKVVEDNRRSVDIAGQRYKEGLSSFIDVLDAKRTLYTSQSALVTAKAQASHDLIALYKSLGGGWVAPAVAAPAAPAPAAPATLTPPQATSPLALTK